MADDLFSPRWHRIAHLRPQLRPQVQLRPQSQRGADWFLLIDSSADEVRRINRSACEFVGRFDGLATVDTIWQTLLRLYPEEAMTQEETLRLLVQLYDRGLVQFDGGVDVEALFVQRRQERRRKRSRRVNPLAFQVPLGNPERFLERLQPLALWLYSPAGVAAWLLLVGAGLVAALQHLAPLTAHARELFATPRWMFLAWLLYPAVKLVHEMAHGLAVHRWGGRVREVGVLLLVMAPVPFVNASAADGFRFRHQRALVSAAGIMAELAMAAAAVLLWQWLQPSLLRDLALLVVVTGLLSTLLVNGNPLMRFDGYFLMCDVLDLRNLAARSTRWWAETAARRILGTAPAAGLEPLPGERGWLLAYAPLALGYRLLLSFAIVLWLGGFSVPLGTLLGFYLAWSQIVWPAWRLLRGTVRTVAAQPRRAGPAARALASLGAVVLVVFVLPLPFGTVAEGIVWMPDRAQIRTGTDGFIDEILVADGQPVAPGDVLVRLRDERLDLEWARLDADRLMLETQMYQAIAREPRDAPRFREQLLYAEAALARVAEQRDELAIRAQVGGHVVLPRAGEQIGRFHAKGALLGYVRTPDPLVVRVALPQDQAQLVRAHRGAISVRLAQEAHAATHAARLQRDLDAAVTRLPSGALGERGGGALVTAAEDPDGLTSREPVVLMDVEVPQVRGSWVGARAAVRFDHGHLDLASQLARRVRQLVLQRFDTSA